MATSGRRGRPKGGKNVPTVEIAGEEEVQAQDIGSSEKVSSMEEGSDPGDLFASDTEKSIEVIHQEKKWIFKYKDLTWGDKNKCLDEAQEWKNGEFKFSISKYYAIALTRMLTQTPIRPITEMTLQKLDRMVGEQLTAIVPQPIEAPPDLEELKKV
jgi:hypothetical protein